MFEKTNTVKKDANLPSALMVLGWCTTGLLLFFARCLPCCRPASIVVAGLSIQDKT